MTCNLDSKHVILLVAQLLLVAGGCWSAYNALNDVMFWGHSPAVTTIIAIVVCFVLAGVVRFLGKRVLDSVAPDLPLAPDLPKAVITDPNIVKKCTSFTFNKKPVGDKSGTFTLKQKPKKVLKSTKKRRKIKVPFLRVGLRIVAGLLVVVNFLISQGILVGGGQSSSLFLLFFFNSLMFVYFLYKTRDVPELE